MRAGALVLALWLTGCANYEMAEATIELEAEDGTREEFSISAETFHVNGFVDIANSEGHRLSLTMLQHQPGRYQTSGEVVTPSGLRLSGTIELDASVPWIGSRDYPFAYEFELVGGSLSTRTGETRKVVGGEISIANKGCTASGGLGASSDCGNGFHYWKESGATVDVKLGDPTADPKFSEPLCPAELVEQWLTGSDIVLTSDELDLGKDSVPCRTTQDSALICGASETGISADGCKDWRVTVAGWPNATAGNPDFSLVIAGGASCGDTSRVCRTLWFSSSYVKR